MSILLGKRKPIFEAEEDENTSGTENAPEDSGSSTDNNSSSENDDNQDQTDDQPTEDDVDQDLSVEDEDNQDDDFSIDDNVDMEDDSTGDEESTDSSGSDGGSDNEPPEVDPDSLKAKDAEMFDSLSPSEQKAKIKALKNLYIDLYSKCENLMDKFNTVSLEYDDSIEQFKRIVSTLYGLKKMVSDYLLNTFDSSSYLENDIMFNRYLAVLNSIKNVSIDIKKIYKDDILDS